MGFFDLLSQFTSRFVLHDVSAQTSLTTTTHTSSLPLTSLHMPIEVVINILEHAHLRDELKPDTQLLVACSLVCKDWSIVAQKLLFRHVSLRSARDFAAFQLAVGRSNPRSIMLGDAVTSLRCVVDTKQPRGLTQTAFAQAVALCPNLSEVSLALYGDVIPREAVGATEENNEKVTTSFHDTTLASLRDGPQITALQFDNWTSDENALSHLLDVWPSLTSLSISGTHPSIPSDATSIPHALEKLRINFQTSPAPEVFQWLLQSSSSSLHALEFRREPSKEVFDALLKAHGESLTSLVIPSCSAPERVSALARCTGLRELRVEGAGTLPSVFAELPRDLRHLAIAVNKDSVLQTLAQAIRKDDSLTKVTVHVGAGGEQHPQLAAVKIACALKGVELEVTKDIRVLRTISHAPTVPGIFSSPSHTKSAKNQ